MIGRLSLRAALASTALALFVGCSTLDGAHEHAAPAPHVHYVEIVSLDVDALCGVLEQLHGLSFGPENADLGNARVATAPDGSLVGVRAPLAPHDTPIVRTYLAVDDIALAVADAEAGGALIAYGPTVQGDTGTWAIYILGDAQVGLWQR